MSSDKTELDLHWHGETELAIRVSENGDEERAVWLPKSQVEFARTRTGVSVELPEWLAEREGLA
jgi:hypothetical protein